MRDLGILGKWHGVLQFCAFVIRGPDLSRASSYSQFGVLSKPTEVGARAKWPADVPLADRGGIRCIRNDRNASVDATLDVDGELDRLSSKQALLTALEKRLQNSARREYRSMRTRSVKLHPGIIPW